MTVKKKCSLCVWCQLQLYIIVDYAKWQLKVGKIRNSLTISILTMLLGNDILPFPEELQREKKTLDTAGYGTWRRQACIPVAIFGT